MDFPVEIISKNRLQKETTRLDGNAAFAEYSLLLEQVANPILKYHRFFFHGAAFIWREKAFLFVGKSGVGKTTQLRHWLALYSEEIEIINGDKPVIEQRGNEFIVYPSPWTGKEGWNGTRSAKLAGIIYLKQGEINHISRMEKRLAVFPLFLQFLYLPTDEESVDLICGYEQALLDNIPVWCLVNDGTREAAQLTHQTLNKEFLQNEVHV